MPQASKRSLILMPLTSWPSVRPSLSVSASSGSVPWALTSLPSFRPSPSVSGFSGSVSCVLTSAPSDSPSSSESGSFGSVPIGPSSPLGRPSPSGSLGSGTTVNVVESAGLVWPSWVCVAVTVCGPAVSGVRLAAPRAVGAHGRGAEHVAALGHGDRGAGRPVPEMTGEVSVIVAPLAGEVMSGAASEPGCGLPPPSPHWMPPAGAPADAESGTMSTLAMSGGPGRTDGPIVPSFRCSSAAWPEALVPFAATVLRRGARATARR